MGIYKFSQSKIIDEITVKRSEGGHTRVYLHAADGADEKQLHNVICTLAEDGMPCTPYNLNGKPVLEVDIKYTEPKLIKLFEEKGWVSGQSQYVKNKEDRISFKETIKKRSLAASGLFYVLGDAAFTTYGYKGGSWENMVAGLFYGAGTVSLLGFGRKDQSDLQIRDVSKAMSQYMKDYGANLSKDCSLDSITNEYDRGLIKKSDDLFRRYPSEMMNLFFACAGGFIARSAQKYNLHTPPSHADVEDVYSRKLADIQKEIPGTRIAKKDMKALHKEVEHALHVNHKREGWLDIGLGGMTAASGLFAMSVKEKAPDPDSEPKKGIAGAWETIQHKPLAIAGVGYMVSTLCHAVSTTIAWNHATTEKRKSVPFRAIFVGANLIAETLLAISSKGHGTGVKSDNSVDNTVIALAAEAIVKQPANMQNMLVEHVARFLGRPDTLALKDKDVTDQLRQQVELMRKNPWARVSEDLKQVNLQAEQPAVAGEKLGEKKDGTAAWQAKLVAQEKSPTQPQMTS